MLSRSKISGLVSVNVISRAITHPMSIDYARTCREWRHRFDTNFDSHIQPALLKKYPNLSEQDVLIFQRKWQCKCKLSAPKKLSILTGVG